MRRHKRTKAQALVEFALAATLIFTLLAAAVDLGLIFFTIQGLRNAAQEGATFGSYPEIQMDSGGRPVIGVLREAEIRDRVRYESGANPVGFANLTDLNNDGTPDDETVLKKYILITSLRDLNSDGKVPDTNNDVEALCSETDLAARPDKCFIRVTIKYDYQVFFPLAPVLKDKVTLQVSHILDIRSPFRGSK